VPVVGIVSVAFNHWLTSNLVAVLGVGAPGASSTGLTVTVTVGEEAAVIVGDAPVAVPVSVKTT
jgi:hypothetical protein